MGVELMKAVCFPSYKGSASALQYKDIPIPTPLESPSGKKYDAIIHSTAARTPWSTFQAVLAEPGKVIDLTPSAGSFLLGVKHKLVFAKQRVVNFIMDANGGDLQLVVALTAEGKLKTVIDPDSLSPRCVKPGIRAYKVTPQGKL